jgi:hypothetical protein
VTGAILRGTDAGRVVACHPCPGFSVEVSVGATCARCTALRHLRPWHSERGRVKVPETRQTVGWQGCCGQRPQVCRGVHGGIVTSTVPAVIVVILSLWSLEMECRSGCC